MRYRTPTLDSEASGAPASPLFRAEAMSYQLDRLHGTVAVATPVSWAWIGCVIAALALMVICLSLLPYASGTTIRGVILPDQVAITIAASQPGVVSDVFIAEGQRVAPGDRLIAVRGDLDIGSGTTGAQADITAAALRRTPAGSARIRIVRATQRGVVTDLRVRPDQHLTRGQSLMRIVSVEGQPFAELRLSPDAIGSIAIGQEVRLALDAFPNQASGTVRARVVGIARREIQRPGGAAPMFVYRVRIRPDEPWIIVQGRKQPLLPGMSVSARIVTAKRRLLDWLALPFSQVMGR